ARRKASSVGCALPATTASPTSPSCSPCLGRPCTARCSEARHPPRLAERWPSPLRFGTASGVLGQPGAPATPSPASAPSPTATAATFPSKPAASSPPSNRSPDDPQTRHLRRFSVLNDPSTINWTVIGDTKELTIHGSHLGPYCYPKVIDALATGKV